MKRPLQFSLLPLVIILMSATEKKSTYIGWTPSRKLQWEDFRGVANHHSHADAATAVQISARPFYYKKKLHYDVRAYFIPEQSWYREKSETLLRHEQLHFDIAELYARKVRKMIAAYAQMGVKDVDDYNEAIRKILNESNRLDAQYDFSTLHGTIQQEQARWEKEIDMELSQLDRFSSANRR